jgi:hypothetical protein
MQLTLDELTDLMLNHVSYPENPPFIELAKTLTSLVFLTDKFVYKIKKPFTYRSKDLSNLEKRKEFCYNDMKYHLQFHKQYPTRVYIKVVPIYYNESKAQLSVGKKNIPEKNSEDWHIVDYAIKMHKLSEEQYLEYRNAMKNE